MRNRRWAVRRARGGCWRRARLARAGRRHRRRRGACAPCPSRRCRRARWLTLETPHFELHFYPEEQEFAERVGARRRARLSPDHPLPQLASRAAASACSLTDQTDAANGGASSVPYNFIYAYGAPPDGLDELSDFDDFVKLLITHEFTHVVHLDTILSWCPRLVDSVLGKIYAPNLSQPTWFIEGLAVLMESRQTTAGPPAQQLLRHAPAGAVSRGTAARPRRGLGRFGPLVYPGRQRPLPLRLAACSATSRTATGPRRSARSPTATRDECIAGGINRVAGAGGRPPLRERVRRRTLGRLEALASHTLRAAEARRRSGAG